MIHSVCLGLLLTLSMAAGEQAGQVREIPDDWKAAELRPLPVAAATASSQAASDNQMYAPRRAVDGQRGTKWVAAVAPTETAPQWITLELLGAGRRVSAFALLGEPVDNDGVLDAQVQVLLPAGEFHTVATVRQARSRHWLATFEPVETTAVRLLITRSGGPSPHTDIYEIGLYGPPLSAEQYRTEVQRRLAELVRQVPDLVAAAGDQVLQAAAVRHAADALATGLERISAQVDEWDALDRAEQADLAAQLDRLGSRAARFQAKLERLGQVWPARAADIAAARHAADQFGPVAKVATGRAEQRVLMANRHVLVSLDRNGRVDLTWRGGADAAVRGARLVVEIDGKRIPLGAAEPALEPFTDKLGSGMRLRQRWEAGVVVERSVRLYDDRPDVVFSGRITNSGPNDVSLGTVRLLEVDAADGGWWHVGQSLQAPAAVYVEGAATVRCRPAWDGDLTNAADQNYRGTGLVALASRCPATGLVVGYLTSLEAQAEVRASFRLAEGGRGLSARLPFLGRILGPGESLELDAVAVAAGADPYALLESYAAATAALAPQPVRTGPTALWCSWYAHRMAMTEDLVLANAAVAAKHFKPLGFKIIQLDHGWQRGDVTGDWYPNERFPHGLKWLAEQLETRYGLQLGVWIAPVDVADTSRTFAQHADWLLRDGAGKPKVNWRWYWPPNPNCYVLDASNPAAAKWIEDVFARLVADGVQYFKIDFIVAAGRTDVQVHDPKVTRGWSVLRRAMESVRRGAGPDAWIRYCQTPPLLSAGLANSAYGGPDTLDAGIEGRFDLLRTNARTLAASYWINGRLYQREVCDMSVRMQAGVEEARVRLAMMALAGCSISFSDELQYLPPSRIGMMQQVLPPGSPPLRPLDLFDRKVPSVWHIRCKNDADQWDVVGLFNFGDRPAERVVDLEALGVPAGGEVAVFEFWQERFLGVHRDRVTLTLPPQSSQVLSIRQLAPHPQLIGTNMHLLQGYHELKKLAWDEDGLVLSGTYQRMPGLAGRAFFYLPDGYYPRFGFPLGPAAARLTHVAGPVWMQEIQFDKSALDWSIPFQRSSK